MIIQYSALNKILWDKFWQRLITQPITIIAGIIVISLIMISLFSPWLVPFDAEYYFDYNCLNNGPSKIYWFGVDSLGRDIFSRILIGSRISILFSLFSVTIGMLIGVFLGLLSGYYQGWLEIIIMRICNVLLAFPGILLAIVISIFINHNIYSLIVAVIIFNIPSFIYLVRNTTLIIKSQTYIESAYSIGATDNMIMFKHILPNILPSIIVFFTMRISTAIITLASLSFLGIGTQSPIPDWGTMLNEARADMLVAPHIIIFPSLAIFLTVLAFNILGDGLQNIFNPKFKI